MKRTLILILTVVIAALSLSSCSTMLPARFETFANSVENNSDSYTLRKWERKNDKFKSLCNEYKSNFTRYSAADRRKIHSAMATYVKAASKSGIVTVTDAVSDIAGEVSSLIDEAKTFFSNLGLKLGKKDK